MQVKAWVEQVSIPTYRVGQPEKNPMFLEKRVYQGSSGVVYPHPVIEKIEDEKTDMEYTAVFLENEYLKIMILPELGGRIQRAYDKVKDRDFVYYNRVIKPALVGLAGPWISGGIEFNWPQHHRPSTFSPVDFTLEEGPDGSQTVWVNELEVMFRTRGMAGFTLYPEKAYLEIKGRLFNPTPFPQTFLWWANPAVKVNEHYQSIFPPDVYAVFDHGKRDVSDFPMATGTYYKVNYAPGTDISRYHTIPVPTSYMAIQSQYDFIGCYEHDTGGGMLHVADHHFSPGKKQWTWGNGNFGYAWDRNLTDEDGPYIELMTGVFTDNQPDFSWIGANESKSFEQYFMPFAGIGGVKNATKEALVNMEWEGARIKLGAYATANYKNTRILLYCKERLVKEFRYDLSPAEVFRESFAPEEVGANTDWKIVVQDAAGKELVAYQPLPAEQKEVPPPASAARTPAEIEQVEELFLNGLHLEQYRHATFNPIDYYEEGLRRSPGDIRCNNALGLLLLRRGQFEKAEPYFRRAIQTITQRNPNPYDGEPYFNLGCCLKWQGRLSEAYDAFYKATWNDAWQHSGFLEAARIAAAQGNWEQALLLTERSLVRNGHSSTARHLKALLLRRLGRPDISFLQESMTVDPFNYGCLYELYRVCGTTFPTTDAESYAQHLKTLMRGALNNYLELSLAYAAAGACAEAAEVIRLLEGEEATAHPLYWYYLGYFAFRQGRPEEAAALYRKGAAQNPGCCFPNKLEEILIFRNAMDLNSGDGRAAYFLGNLWYDKRQYPEAIACWEASARADGSFPTVFRNLSLASCNKLGDKTRALEFMERAFVLDSQDARVLMELDQLYKITGKSFEERLQLLEQHRALVVQRDDLYLERVVLYNNRGEFEKAKALLAARKFHPWEGGEGKVVGQYLLCHLELAKQNIREQRWEEALKLLTALQQYPENLGEGKLFNTPENDIDYLLGCVYEGLQQTEQAMECFTRATKGNAEPAQAIYYNDPQPDKIFYQALAWIKLGERKKATQIFERFIRFGEEHLNDAIRIDYFAVSLPDMLVFDIDLEQRNRLHCRYLMGLGYLGLGDLERGVEFLKQVLSQEPNHQGAAVYLAMIPLLEESGVVIRQAVNEA